MNVEHFPLGQHPPLPELPVGHCILTTAGREARVFERPIEKAVQNNRISSILAEEVAFVAGIAGNGIVAVQIGGIVVAKLHAVDEPQPAHETDHL